MQLFGRQFEIPRRRKMRKLILSIALLFALQLSSDGVECEEGLKYYPVDQCRVLDTRVKARAWCVDFNENGEYEDWECISVPQNGTLAFVLAGDAGRIVLKNRGYGEVETNIGDQGTAPDGCGIPRDAKVVSMMMAVIPQYKRAGHVKVWPFEIAYYLEWGGIPAPVKAPNTSHINFSAGETVESTWFLQKICDPATANYQDCNEDILITAKGSPVHVIIDVNGYFRLG
jgi:hypothetical protein